YLLNPNTKTCSIFRSRRDTDINRKVYNVVPIIMNEEANTNPWTIIFSEMFHMTNDANLFHLETELSGSERLFANRYRGPEATFLPLYEGKMLDIFDSRFASVIVNSENP